MSQVLVDHCYANDRLALIFYNTDTQAFEFWQRLEQEHLSFAYVLKEGEEWENFKKEHGGVDSDGKPTSDLMKAHVAAEEVELYHPVWHRNAKFIKTYFKSPIDVRRHMSESNYFENHLKYYARFCIDEDITFGMPYDTTHDSINHTTSYILTKHKKLRADLGKLYDQDIADDLLLSLLTPVPDMPYIAMDAEMLSRGNVIPNPAIAAEPIISIALLFRNKGNMHGTQLCLKESVRGDIGTKLHKGFLNDKRLKRYDIEWFEDERKLIKRFFELMLDPNYRLLITFNGDNFDLQYLYHRAKFLGLWSPLRYRTFTTGGGRVFHDVNIEPRDPVTRAPDMKHWKIHLDLYKFFSQSYIKGYAFLNAYTDNRLDTICEALLGVGKVPLDTSINDLSVFELIHYNMQDVFLLDDLMQMNNNQVLNLIFLLMRLGVEPMGECYRKAISSKIGHFIQKWITKRGHISPRRMDLRQKDEEAYGDLSALPAKYRGAIVIDPKPGYYFGVECRDFTGLYTNTIANNNLSFETMNCGHSECITNVVPDVGHHVCTKEKGIMAQVVGLVTTARKLHFKKLAKDDPTFGPVEQVLKVFGNATYGVFGATFFPYYLRILAESITAFSRDYLERMIEKAKELGMRVLYGDTDSVFVDQTTPQSMKTLVEWVDKELGLELTLDYDLSLFCISSRKKNYFGIKKDGKPIVKGFKIKKRTSPPIISGVGNKIIDMLVGVSDETTLELVSKRIMFVLRVYYNKIWKCEGDITDYAFTTQITKPIKQYKTITAHVRAAIIEAEAILADLPEGVSATAEDLIQPGTLQTFIKSNMELVRRPSGRGKRIGVLPMTMATNKDIEPSHYHKEMVSSVSQIVEPIGIKPEDYITEDPTAIRLDEFLVNV